MKSALRLCHPADFARAKRQGKAQRHPSMLISYCANELPRNRYGIVVGKHIGIAVIRNRIKRRVRAVLGNMHLRLRQGYDIVVIVRRGVTAQPFSELCRILYQLFRRAQLIETT